MPPPHGLPSGTMGRRDNELIYIYREQCKQKLCDSSRQRLAPNVYISLFIGLSLKEYAVARGADCQNRHMQPCLECGVCVCVCVVVCVGVWVCVGVCVGGSRRLRWCGCYI